MPACRALYVPLAGEAADALFRLAEREYRQPRDQAAKLLVEAFERAGALPAETDRSNATSAAVAVDK